MDRNTFDTLLRDLINHLYDSITLETHPLTATLTIPPNYRGRRGEYIRQEIITAIQLLSPPTNLQSLDSLEWRSYQILYKRYIESISPPSLATQLAISERQLRRDHSRALEALSQRLWERLFPAENGIPRSETNGSIEPIAPDFNISPERLDLVNILNGVMDILGNRIRTEKIHLRLPNPPLASVGVIADRVVLRQILLSLFIYALRLRNSQEIDVSYSSHQDEIRLEISFETGTFWSSPEENQDMNPFQNARNWGEKLNIQFEVLSPPRGKSGRMTLAILIPSAMQDIILVIDDQETTLRMYQRYLSRTIFKVIGIEEPVQALKIIADLCPALILLDVMMPIVDGWEILQSLRSNSQTKHIPVIVCSAWEASDLAHSLGAVNFLKKPITQRDLLKALKQIDLIKETSA